VRYARWRATPAETPPTLADVQPERAATLLGRALREKRDWLGPDEVRQLLACYGLPLVEQQLVHDADAAASAAEGLGQEVALKAVLPGAAHKSEAGGVRLHLVGAAAVQDAAEAMSRQVQAATGHPPIGFLVQRMAEGGVEMLVGVVNDARFGPTVACSSGGVLVELVRDVAVRLAPLLPSDAAEMVRELRSFPLLNGYRGSAPCAVEALEDVLLRVGALADAHPEIAELDCNPVIVTPSGAIIVDARVRVAPPSRTPPHPSADELSGQQLPRVYLRQLW
jgi:acyl-CoA synthetase (NDP forming)